MKYDISASDVLWLSDIFIISMPEKQKDFPFVYREMLLKCELWWTTLLRCLSYLATSSNLCTEGRGDQTRTRFQGQVSELGDQQQVQGRLRQLLSGAQEPCQLLHKVTSCRKGAIK